jgi:hypothetical protein
MFILNSLIGAEDPRCPISGLGEAISKTAKAYEESGCAEKFMVPCILLSLHLLLRPLLLIWNHRFNFVLNNHHITVL